MQEWLNWPLSKSGKVKAFEGSNPSLSAKQNRDHQVSVLFGAVLQPS